MERRVPAAARRRQPQAAKIGAAVESALRQDRLLFAFQPVVCAASGEVDYFECLLRMREDDGGLVACGEFIAAVEEVGPDRADRPARAGAGICRARRPSRVRLGFNVSGLTAGDRPWLRSLMSLLRKQPELAHRIVVEITETAALDDLDESARFVETLRHAGCRVALDDFGAGHTSLRHLQMLAVDTIKIDGSFVRSLAACRENRVILRHLLGLTRGFGLHTVAECVETAEEAALLREEGVGYLQGYHLGRPTIERPWRIGAGRSPATRRPTRLRIAPNRANNARSTRPGGARQGAAGGTAMQIGIHLPHAGEQATPERIRRAAQRAEDMGLSDVWVSEHIIVPRATFPRSPLFYDPVLSLTWAAAVTKRVRLGTSVLVLPMRHPLPLAKELATLQNFSEGRLILGAGVGWLEAEFAALGAPFHERGRRMDEGIAMMRAVWTQDPVTLPQPNTSRPRSPK